ncbi:hypothetical protein [Halorientalis regularis]|uniref:Uncharacterized protein n=1 Tax=Halorientalis regularis TaxID=660518 RepID=A0A1G7UED9_9EURY|nr:hypothetical protein [Halorientalis regularis]SDG45651.1 hypothetical protein SAMN05216218_1514 [Halorientalis regularis]
MSIPQPRTETKTDSATNVGEPEGIQAETPPFATAGDLVVTVTNTHDEPADVFLESARASVEHVESVGVDQSYSRIPPIKTAAANGGTVTFDSDDLGDGDTFYRVVATFAAEPTSGEISAEFEQLNVTRGTVLDSL